MKKYQENELLEIKEKTLHQQEKLKAKAFKNETKINRLLKLKTTRRRTKQIVALNEKNQMLSIRDKRLSEKLILIEKQTLSKENIFKKFGKWFKNIPYSKQLVIWGIIFLIPWLIGMLILFLPSFFQTIWWSFFEVAPEGRTLSFKFVGIENYKFLIQGYVIDSSRIFLSELVLFVQNLIIDLPIIIIFSILIAVLLNKKFKGHTIVKAIFFIPVIYNLTLINDTLTGGFGEYLTEQSTANILFVEQFTWFFLDLGLGQDLIEIVMNAVGRIFMIINLSGIQILIFIAAIQSIPEHLYEAAKIEGATKYEIFWKITIAMITPLILTAAIYTVIDSFARAPIFRFIKYATTSNKYGLAASISVLYFLINIAIIGLIYALMRKRVFYYED
ncbi:MAG: sugar ABC transporter permease [Acholeplasmatales bacterium]|jgi:ABC-type sugar transport system permease subunit|nr:sugar ABC transporter permease [Acholeplasmataceae bacterium]MDY0114998.1 sugar ABC transporter permease [Acholeplasmatales bacterium]MCK9233776.1 sugar ABC transporter permease [Acholeplasmataceae bacterium]MCK9288999.1 sugar ABC transporter permease [Acholeplasmataceae bacterium]MCK9427864.1 sugar ABC transporter permease [Acholeplasmataceae bacterium]